MKQLLIFSLLISCFSSAIYAEECELVADNPKIDFPRDYRRNYSKWDKQNIEVVEKHHFTPQVENLIRGITTEDPIFDIAYTLRRIPNHYRALHAMIRAREREQYKKLQTTGRYARLPSMDCYFRKAHAIAPDDANVYLLEGNYQYKRTKYDDAIKLYRKAFEMNPGMVDAIYNSGLAFFAKKDYKNARVAAEKAYSLGYPLPGLKEKLKSVGHWKNS